MNILAWIKSLLCSSRLEIDDPVFGPLQGEHVEYRGDRYVFWVCRNTFRQIGEDVEIRVCSDEDGPAERQRQLFTQLLGRFPAVRETIEGPLSSEYNAIRESWEMTSPEITATGDVWTLAHLRWVEVCRGDEPDCEVALNYQIDWDAEDHDLSVVLAKWQVTQVTLEG
jgi:hypothetical protein